MRKFGYARVSSRGQDLAIQREKLEQAGCDSITSEKVSGKSLKGRKLAGLIDLMQSGDMLVVTRLDRFARNSQDAQNLLADLNQRGIGLQIIDQGIDTGTIAGKLLFDVLAAVAEMERLTIAERTSEGRAKAIERGVKFGRKSTLSDKRKEIIFGDLESMTVAAVAEKHGITERTVYRLKKTDAKP